MKICFHLIIDLNIYKRRFQFGGSTNNQINCNFEEYMRLGSLTEELNRRNLETKVHALPHAEFPPFNCLIKPNNRLSLKEYVSHNEFVSFV